MKHFLDGLEQYFDDGLCEQPRNERGEKNFQWRDLNRRCASNKVSGYHPVRERPHRNAEKWPHNEPE